MDTNCREFLVGATVAVGSPFSPLTRVAVVAQRLTDDGSLFVLETSGVGLTYLRFPVDT